MNFKYLKLRFNAFCQCQSGATIIEYGLLAALVGVIAVSVAEPMMGALDSRAEDIMADEERLETTIPELLVRRLSTAQLTLDAQIGIPKDYQ